MKKVFGLCLMLALLVACASKESAQFGQAQRLAEKGQFAKAIQIYSRIIKDNPENYAAWASRGLLYERLGGKDGAELKKNKQLAERDYLRALGLNYLRPEILNNLAALYIDEGRYEQAIGYLNQALALRPNYFMALINRAVAYSQQGKIGSALVDFSAAQELDNFSPLLYLNRGLAQFAAGYYAGATQDYTDLAELEPKNPRPYLERGRAFVKMGHFQNAMDDFQKAMALRPDYAMPYFYAAELLFNKGETDEAIAYAERAKQLAPNYAPVYDMLGDMLALESPVDATKHYLAARRLNPRHAAYYQNKIRLMTTEEGRKRVVAGRFFTVGGK